jgi:large subunit ribosomal protein L30
MAKSPATMTKQVKVTLIKSVYGQIHSHRASVSGLGLRRIRDSRVLADTPEIRGMIRSATHLLKVEEL